MEVLPQRNRTIRTHVHESGRYEIRFKGIVSEEDPKYRNEKASNMKNRSLSDNSRKDSTSGVGLSNRFAKSVG